jgi:hypothetical protein
LIQQRRSAVTIREMQQSMPVQSLLQKETNAIKIGIVGIRRTCRE